MKSVLLVFPHQLFASHPGLTSSIKKVFLIEDALFFGDQQYPLKFHKQKLVLHRASMKSYQDFLSKSHETEYREYANGNSVLRDIFDQIKNEKYTDIHIAKVVDFTLEKRIIQQAKRININLHWIETPMFLNTSAENTTYRESKKRWFMADFYKWQRTRLDILMEDDKPKGGKWSFDEDNRKKLPKREVSNIPLLPKKEDCVYVQEAKAYVETFFADNYGSLDDFIYPINFTEATSWLDSFLTERFHLFGPYEDAIVQDQNYLYHSVITPALNIGLLTPRQVIETTLNFAEKNDIEIASLEGFIRQIIGWREFMRATYEDLGVTMRTTNSWNHTKPIPKSFYTATTDILPVDNAIERILDTGYCHHIERLMVLGGFMFLCEIDPDEIYAWFMEMFIDSYDWVMVPNVYAMSQNADGGNITTKPYFSGSNYVKKMSHYSPDDWCDIWDALYWDWILKNATELKKNYRWAMMVRMGEKKDQAQKEAYKKTVEKYMNSL